MEKIKKIVNEFLEDFKKRYKIPKEIFLEDFVIKQREDNFDVFVYINIKYKVRYEFLSIYEVVVLLQKLIVNPCFVLPEGKVNIYFVIDTKKKISSVDVPVSFQVNMIDVSLDKMLQPVVDSKLPDILMGWYLAKNIVGNLQEVLSPETLKVPEMREGIYVI